MNTKVIWILMISLVLFGVFSQFGVYAETSTSGVAPGKAVRIREWKTQHQNKFDNATDIHFKIWQKEDDINVTGWKIEISKFTQSTSQRGIQPDAVIPGLNKNPHRTFSGMFTTKGDPDNGQHAVDVTAWGANISRCQNITIKATFNLTYWNEIELWNVTWTNATDPMKPRPADMKKAEPNHGWQLDWPREDPKKPGVYWHNWTIFNHDWINLTIAGLTFLPTMVWYENLTDIIFPDPPYPDFTLRPGESRSIIINTTGSLVGGHIYFKYIIKASEEILSENLADHEITQPPLSVLIITATTGGTTNPPPGIYNFSYPTVVSVLAIPYSGYVFDHWELDGVNVGALQPLETPPWNHTLCAVFRSIVGGIAIPVDKLALFAPYVGLAFTVLAITVAATVYVKRVKRRKEKQ